MEAVFIGIAAQIVTTEWPMKKEHERTKYNMVNYQLGLTIIGAILQQLIVVS